MKSMAGMITVLILLGQGPIGCSRKDAPERAEHVDHKNHQAPPPSNRIEVPEMVRRNLGITFAQVETRAVAKTLRVPGQFELLSEAKREYRTMLAGRVELHVQQFQEVRAGDALYTLASPEWRELQSKLNEADSAIRQTEARVGSIPTLIAAHRRHEEILEKNIDLWTERVDQLDRTRGSGMVTAEAYTMAQNTLANQQAELAEILEKEADLEGQIASAQAEHDAAHARFRLLIATASTLLDMDEAALVAPYSLDEHMHSGVHRHDAPQVRPEAKWRQINDVLIRASVPGVVATQDVTNGGWAPTGTLVLTSIDPLRLRFRAAAMQGDLGRLRAGLPARIVPPKGGSIDLQDSMEATLTLGLGGDTQDRTIELLAIPARLTSWARPGVSAHLEVVTEGGGSELAIPLSCLVQDGLERVFFRRDPKDPDKVIRVEADLGIDDGRWVVVQSGVREGDEIVLDGAYQLMIATSGTVQQGGHFHADGTFHADEDH